MEVTSDLMEEIKKGLESIEFGKVTISVDSGSLTADVSIERRVRHKMKRREDAGTIVKAAQR
jgi:hypothetical protein